MGLLKALAKRVLGRDEKPPVPATAPPAKPPSSAPPGAEGATDKPWYLDGQNDGWDTTDVKKDE